MEERQSCKQITALSSVLEKWTKFENTGEAGEYQESQPGGSAMWEKSWHRSWNFLGRVGMVRKNLAKFKRGWLEGSKDRGLLTFTLKNKRWKLESNEAFHKSKFSKSANFTPKWCSKFLKAKEYDKDGVGGKL